MSPQSSIPNENHEAFDPVGNPLVVEFLNSIFPEKKVGNFSLHFDMSGVAYIRADIILEDQVAKQFFQMVKELQLHVPAEDVQPVKPEYHHPREEDDG